MSVVMSKIRCPQCKKYHDIKNHGWYYDMPFVCRRCGARMVKIEPLTANKS